MTKPEDLYPDYPAMLTEAILAPHKQENKPKWGITVACWNGDVELPLAATMTFNCEERKWL
jgi:hypothetical protein